MAREVSPRELAQRFVTFEGARGRKPFVEQRERMLLAIARTETDQPRHGEVTEHVQPARVGRRDAG